MDVDAADEGGAAGGVQEQQVGDEFTVTVTVT